MRWFDSFEVSLTEEEVRFEYLIGVYSLPEDI